MMRNKMAVAFVPLLAFIMFVGGIVMVFYYGRNAMEVSVSFGAPQRELLESYAEGEALRSYIIQSAKYAAHQAVFSIGTNGGYTSAGCSKEAVPECTVSRGGTEVEQFSCIDKADTSLCSRFEIVKKCMTFPCKFEMSAVLTCDSLGGKVICSVSGKNTIGSEVIFSEFNCLTASDGKCGYYGAEIKKSKNIGLSVSCEAIPADIECETAECGAIGPYVYWHNEGKSCVPDEIRVKTTFGILFMDFFDNYLQKYTDLTIGESSQSLYDAVEYKMDIDLDNKVITGFPAKETYTTLLEDEMGTITGTEEESDESYLWIRKTVEDPEDIRPTVTFDYYVNPYFTYDIPFSPEKIISDAKGRANGALKDLGDCGEDIATKASNVQSSLSSDAEYIWKLSGERIDNACVVKVEATPKTIVVYGVDQTGTIVGAQTLIPVRFALKYTGAVPSLA